MTFCGEGHRFFDALQICHPEGNLFMCRTYQDFKYDVWTRINKIPAE